MTLQDLGNLGEFVSAIAVVVTLVYLALQIRHNTRALGHAEGRAILEDGNTWRAKLIQDPEIAKLYRRAFSIRTPLIRSRSSGFGCSSMLYSSLGSTGSGQAESLAMTVTLTSGERSRDPAGRREAVSKATKCCGLGGLLGRIRRMAARRRAAEESETR